MQRLLSTVLCIVFLTSCSFSGSESSSGAVVPEIKSQGVQVLAPTLLWGRYQEYSAEFFALAKKETDKKILLFFQDGTCATCRETTYRIIRTMNKIPGGKSIGFKVRMGMDFALEKKYSIKKSGTIVLLSGEKEIARREGNVSEEELVSWMKK